MAGISRAAKRFNRITRFLGRLATRSYLSWLTQALTTALAKITVASKKGRKKETVEEITEEWLRMFPKEICSIEKIEDDTGFGQVHADCLLVGTGDVKACYKMMNYDRKMVSAFGGELTVIESRANPNVKGCCKVAIRKINDYRKDLIPAHQIEGD